MNELILALNAAGIRYLLVGGQAMRLTGMPRFSMDWDFFIPPRDEKNFATLNDLLRAEIDLPLVAVGSRGENFIQTYQTRWGILQFHLGLPGVPRFPQMISLLRNFIHGWDSILQICSAYGAVFNRPNTSRIVIIGIPRNDLSTSKSLSPVTMASALAAAAQASTGKSSASRRLDGCWMTAGLTI